MPISNLWTPERVQYLRDHYQTMMTRDIADHLVVVTRNAVIGKARRLGLLSRHKLQPPRKPRIVMPKKPVIIPVKKPPPPKLAVGRVSFADLEEWHCRQIVQDEPLRYCGAVKIEHSSYCIDHHQINHVNVRQINVEKHYGI